MDEAEATAYLAMLNSRWPGDIDILAEQPYLELLGEHTTADAGIALNNLFRNCKFRPSGPELEAELVEVRRRRLLDEQDQLPALPQARMTEADRKEAAAILHGYRERGSL